MKSRVSFPSLGCKPLVLSLIGKGRDRLLLAGVMLGLMPLEVVGAGKGLAAALTLVGPLPIVRADVLRQLGRDAESPAALRTEEVLVPRVDLLVPLEGRGTGEGLAALSARKWPLASVDALVAQQTRGLREGYTAVGALEGPLAGVQRLVLLQVGGFGETLAAGGAGEGPLARVHALMLHHAAGHGKLTAAGGATEGLGAQVRALVAQQRQWPVEGQAALGAREGLVVAVHVALVFAQIGGTHKSPPAVRAPIRFLASVGANVLAVIGGPSVCLVAEGTPVWPLACMEAPVLLERAAMGVGLPTQLTHVGLGAMMFHGDLNFAGLLEGPPALHTPIGTLLFLPAAFWTHLALDFSTAL